MSRCFAIMLPIVLGCRSGVETTQTQGESGTTTLDTDDHSTLRVDVVSVEVSGSPQEFNFAVGLNSPDTGCEQYADWWEVVTPEGELVYRRILTHSHVDEQPFVRDGEPVPVEAEDTLYVRGHLNTTGYGGDLFVGSVQAGFIASEDDPALPDSIQHLDPQPDGCLF